MTSRFTGPSRLSIETPDPYDYEPGEPDPAWNLTQLADFYGTDKGNIDHLYTPAYESLLSHWRDSKISILEVGIACGASLKMWHSYFRNGSIFGVDHNKNCAKLCSKYERVNIRIGNAKRVRFKEMFEVVIDDASHVPEDIIDIWLNLWKNVRKGGYYFIEDVDCVGNEAYRRLFPDRPDSDFDKGKLERLISTIKNIGEVSYHGNLIAIRK